MSQETVTLTTAQAIMRWLSNQFIEIDGQEMRVCGGGFGIFGHGNVTCLGEALYPLQGALPLYRGQNEQSMGFAAAGYAKQWLRQRFMFCTASAGPGTLNLVTAAALAHANRLPMLMLCGDTFLTRLPDPVLQQIENFGDPTFGANDAFRPITRYWDRITHPAQVIPALPAALATLLDPADCGPAFIGLPQDVQGWTYDFPTAFFDRKVHRIRCQTPDADEVAEAAALLAKAERPMIIAGGGVQYARAVAELTAFAETHRIPVVETIAGRANLLDSHPLNIGPIGVTGSNSANAIAEQADVILAVGTRLQDFTTGSWTAFDPAARLISLNAARHDAGKHMALPVVGDAKRGLATLSQTLDYTAPSTWVERAQRERAAWTAYVAENVAQGDNRPNSYAQAIGVVNRLCNSKDRVVAAAGGLPAEVTANWRTRDIGTVDVEFGFSCMGYEIAGAWGARIAQAEREPDQDTITFCGDGSYLMLNSDIYSSVLSQKKLIVLVLDNGGFAVINKLQNNTGNESFNNLFADCPTIPEPFGVDFAAHAAAMGATAEKVANPAELAEAFQRAKASDTTCHRDGRGSLRRLDRRRPRLVGGGHPPCDRQRPGARGACGLGSHPSPPAAGRMMDRLIDGIRKGTCVVFGRAGMDMFADPPGTKAEHAETFRSDLGGSSANICAGLCKLGLQSALVTSVSDDNVGRFCTNRLRHYGVDTQYLKVLGGEHRISLAVYESTMDDFQLCIYRNNAVDFQVTEADVDRVDYTAYGALITAGTVFAAEPSRGSTFRAFENAKAAGVPVIFDIDYRPYSWPSAAVASDVLSRAGTASDLIVGNDEEFGFMAGGLDKGLDKARALAAQGKMVIYKMGQQGAITLAGDQEIRTGIYPVTAVKPNGAGDSFLAGLLAGIAEDRPLREAVLRGSACAAIVVSQPGCAPAMPTTAQLDAFLAAHPGPTDP